MSLMVDTVQVHVPFFSSFCQLKHGSKTTWELAVSVAEIDSNLNICARNVVKRDGQLINIDYYHAYDSIPTSHTGIGYKVMSVSHNSMPHVVLNASIAKILQGHNVYGNTDMMTGVFEILGVFCEFHPSLLTYLDFQNAYIAKFDVTLPCQTPSRFTAEKIREYFRNVDWGRLRNQSANNKRLEYNTLYFGSVNSKVGGFKIYCKGVELDGVLSELTTQAKKGNIKAAKDLQVYTSDVKKFADSSLRIECIVKKRMLLENNLPINLWKFLIHQLNHQHVYHELFRQKTTDFLQSLQGMRMPYDDDAKVYELLIKRLSEPTKSGKISTTKAKNAYNFYKLLKSDGFYEVKKRTAKSTFNRNIKFLCDAGFNRGYLQNLNQSDDTQVIRLLNIDFNARLPASYVPPSTQYYDRFNHFLINAAA